MYILCKMAILCGRKVNVHMLNMICPLLQLEDIETMWDRQCLSQSKRTHVYVVVVSSTAQLLE